MHNKDKQIPKDVAAAISNIIKFLEKSEDNYISDKKTKGKEEEDKL